MSSLTRILCLLLLVFILSLSVQGQESVDFNTYYFGPTNDGRELVIDSTVSRQSELNTSWINEAEFRTRTDEFDFDRQRYTVRVKPSSRKVNKAMNNLMDAYDSKFSIIENESKNDAIDQIYNSLLSAYKIDVQSQLTRQLLQVYQDQNTVYQKLLSTKNSNVVRWLDIQKEVLDLEAELLTMEKEQQLSIEDGVTINWSDIVKIEDILTSLMTNNYLEQGEDSNSEYAIENNIIDQEMQLELAESKSYFNFFQVEYRGPGDDLIRERVAISAAFALPITDNKTKLKLAELRNDQAELALKKQIDEAEKEKEVSEIYNDLIIAIEVNTMRKERLEKMKTDAEIASTTYQEYNLPNPLLLLQQKELILKEEITIANAELDILNMYVDYLSEIGTLYQLPLRNCLLR